MPEALVALHRTSIQHEFTPARSRSKSHYVDSFVAKFAIVLDFVPYVSTLSNVVAIALKLFLGSYVSKLAKKSAYFKHLKSKSCLHCILLSIPWFGNFIWVIVKLRKIPPKEPTSSPSPVRPPFTPVTPNPATYSPSSEYDNMRPELTGPINPNLDPLPLQPQVREIIQRANIPTEEQVRGFIVQPVTSNIQMLDILITQIKTLKESIEKEKKGQREIHKLAQEAASKPEIASEIDFVFLQEVGQLFYNELESNNDDLKSKLKLVENFYQTAISAYTSLYGTETIDQFPSAQEIIQKFQEKKSQIENFLNVEFYQLYSELRVENS